MVKLGADVPLTTATLANLTGLSFAVVSGRTYEFEFTLVVRTTVITVAAVATISIPSATVFAAEVEALFAGDGAGAQFGGAITSSDDVVVVTALPVINTDYLLRIRGVLVPSASGTIQARGRAETTGATITFRRGSCGTLRDFGV